MNQPRTLRQTRGGSLRKKTDPPAKTIEDIILVLLVVGGTLCPPILSVLIALAAQQ